MVQFPYKIIVIDKILQQGRVKIGLQDAVRTIHHAEGSQVEYLVAATGVGPCAGAIFDEGPIVSGQQKHAFTPADRIGIGGDQIEYILDIINDFDRSFVTGLKRQDLSGVGDFTIYIDLG